QACCFTDWCFCNWFKPKEPVCAPAAPAVSVCPQQVSYVPQTAYRTEYQCVPVTTCQQVNTCDPCGGAQTVTQPLTSYVRRPVMVPYTTYRPVVTPLNYATPACTSCGAAPYYSSAGYAATTVAAPSAGCATCGAAASANYATPAVSYTSPAQSTMYAATPA